MPEEKALEFNDEEKLLIYCLGTLNNTPLRTKIKVQKLIFLFSNAFPNFQRLLRYEPHLLGPYSETVENTLSELIKLELITEKDGGYKLTQKGMSVFKHLNPKKEIIAVLSDFKDFLHDLSDDELLAFIYFSYPNFTQESARFKEIERSRVELAISLFSKEKISYSKALEISGKNATEFDNVLKKRGVRWRIT